MAGYQYPPVESSRREIRLLTIHPAEDHRSQISPYVQCTLNVVSLDDTPKYHALSYTWGDLAPPYRKVSLDGIEVEVFVNLEEAVRAFQHQADPVIFWIDAICINQHNPDEKAEQVQMMPDIYSNATIVDVFLGPGNDNTDKAMEAISNLGTAAYNAGVLTLKADDLCDKPHCDMASSFKHPEDNDPLANVKSSLYQLSSSISAHFPYAAWSDIMGREYWKRLWIVQEFCLGPLLRITCGSRTVPYRHCFEAAILFLKIHLTIYLKTPQWSKDAWGPIRQQEWLAEIAEVFSSLTADGPCTSLSAARNRQQRVKGSPGSLFNLLETFCVPDTDVGPRKARYPRDVVYGLLGIAADAKTLNIVPLYTNIESDEETAQIFTSVARNLLKHGHVDILAWCRVPKSFNGLPSWVPDFTCIQIPSCGSTEQGLFAASGRSSHFVRTLEPAETLSGAPLLTLRGASIDTVMAQGSVYTQTPTPAYVVKTTETTLQENAAKTRLTDEVISYCDQAESLGSISRLWAGQASAEAHWRIPCADQRKDKDERSRASPASAQGFKDMRRKLELHTELARHLRELHLTPEELAQKVEQYKEALTPACIKYENAMQYQHNRRPFISTNGYVGLVPAHTEPGDIVIIIFGAIQPFVVRKLEQGRFKLIGEAYVYGIMDGEFLQTQFEEEDFVVC